MRRFALLVIIAAAGCGPAPPPANTSTDNSKSAPTATAPAQPAAAGQTQPASAGDQTAQMQQVAQGLRQLSQSQTTPVDFEMLKTLLPEIHGWTKGRPRGEQVNMPFAISNATAHYTNGESTMDVTITDSALNQLIFAPFSVFMTSGYEERSDDGYKKAMTIAGAPGFEEWKKDSGQAEVTVVVSNRYLVQATGHRVAGIDPVRKAIEAVDLKKLK